MTQKEVLKDMDPEELYGLGIRYLKSKGQRILSVKREDDLWFETIGLEDGKKEIFYIKRGDLSPEDVKSMPKDTKTRIVPLGDVKVKDLAGIQNIEIVDSSELIGFAKATNPLNKEPLERGLPSVGEVEKILKKANESFTKKDYKKALELYSKALALKSNLATVWAAKGETYRALEDYDAALDSYKNALQLDMKNERYWFNMGTVLYKLGRFAEEVECCDMAIKHKPSFIEAWNNKGIALYQLEKYEDAVLCYDVVLKNNPKNELVWNNKGLAFKKLKKREEAIGCFNKAVELNDTFLDAIVNKGVLLYELKDYKSALECFDRALKLNEDAHILYHRGMTLSKLKDYKEAANSLRKASREISHAKRALKRIEKLAGKNVDKKEYPCFGEYEKGDKGCQACEVKAKCRKVST